MKQRATKEEKPQKENKNDNHTSSALPDRAILTKSNNCAQKFSYYIQAEGKSRAQKVYGKTAKTIGKFYGPNLVGYFGDFFQLDDVASNFNSQAKMKTLQGTVHSAQFMPYSWEAHHLIPAEALKEDGKVFGDKEYQVLLKTDYDINNGNNLIALPASGSDFYQPIHSLLLHPGSHPDYTTHVKQVVKKLSKELKNLKEDELHPDAVELTSVNLKQIEDTLWDQIVKMGKLRIQGLEGLEGLTKAEIKAIEELRETHR